MRQLLTVILTLLLLPSISAQTTDRKTLTIDGAQKVLTGAIAEAKKGTGTGAIAIVDDGGNLMLVHRLDATFAAGANISIGKARTAALFKKPTKAFEDIIARGRTAMVAVQDFTPLQGGVPIIVDGQIVGAIGVSGAASAQQDEEIAIAGASALSPATSAASPALYFDAAFVNATFANDGSLTQKMFSRFRVNASRRVEPGLAEIHLDDTDIIYVVKGTATFVTGGQSVETKLTEPGQLRGGSIEGGESRSLKPGDVVIVPPGIPHQFTQVSGEFLYFVVKVS